NVILDKIILIVENSNGFIDHAAPWKLRLDDEKKMHKVLYILAETIRYIAIFLLPFIPESASKILDLLCIESAKRDFNYLNQNNALNPGTMIKAPVPIFPKIEN